MSTSIRESLLPDATVDGYVLHPGPVNDAAEAGVGAYPEVAPKPTAHPDSQWVWPVESEHNPTLPVGHPAAGVALYAAPQAPPAIMGPRGRCSVEVYCGTCHSRGMTKLTNGQGTLYWLAGVCSLSLTMLAGWGHNVLHQCPTCQRVVGVSKLM